MCESCSASTEAPDGSSPAASRLAFLLLCLGVLAGCAKQAAVGPLPGPPWMTSDERREAVQEAVATATQAPPPARAWEDGVLPRSAWARGTAVGAIMNRMTTVRHITVHHDGMDPFFATDRASVAAHLELIRQLHRRRGWGDIGYHFAVDRAGRVWEGRPLMYQGAHVKDHNPGNIGIVVLGNFEMQAPTRAQLAAVRAQLNALMRIYDVPTGRVHTHQEWAGAATLCPGGRLQHDLESLRRNGGLG